MDTKETTGSSQSRAKYESSVFACSYTQIHHPDSGHTAQIILTSLASFEKANDRTVADVRWRTMHAMLRRTQLFFHSSRCTGNSRCLQIPQDARVRPAAPTKHALLRDEAEVREPGCHVCECGAGGLLPGAAGAGMRVAGFRSCPAHGVFDNVNIAREVL